MDRIDYVLTKKGKWKAWRVEDPGRVVLCSLLDEAERRLNEVGRPQVAATEKPRDLPVARRYLERHFVHFGQAHIPFIAEPTSASER